MTVITTQSYQKYIGNGVTKIFSVPFSFVDKELVVFKGETFETYTKGIDYSVEDSYITFNTPIAEGEVIYIARDVLLRQLVDFIDGADFPASDYEYSLDHITHALQELSMWVKQTWRAPLGTEPIDVIDNLFAEVNAKIENETNRAVTRENEIEQAIPTKLSQLVNDSDFATNSSLNTKQDKLVAGDNITIVGNVISSTAGDSGETYITLENTGQEITDMYVAGKRPVLLYDDAYYQLMYVTKISDENYLFIFETLFENQAHYWTITTKGYWNHHYQYFATTFDINSRADTDLSNITSAGKEVINNLIDERRPVYDGSVE